MILSRLFRRRVRRTLGRAAKARAGPFAWPRRPVFTRCWARPCLPCWRCASGRPVAFGPRGGAGAAAVLQIFQYAAGRVWRAFSLLTPVGISFFTFKAVAYLARCTKGALPPAAISDGTRCMFFFPNVWDPSRAGDLMAQIGTPRAFDAGRAVRIAVMLWGYFSGGGRPGRTL